MTAISDETIERPLVARHPTRFEQRRASLLLDRGPKPDPSSRRSPLARPLR